MLIKLAPPNNLLSCSHLHLHVATLLQTSVFIWPALQTINFKFVPAPHRAIFVACCSFFWTTMLAGWKFNSQTIPKPLDK